VIQNSLLANHQLDVFETRTVNDEINYLSLNWCFLAGFLVAINKYLSFFSQLRVSTWPSRKHWEHGRFDKPGGKQLRSVMNQKVVGCQYGW